MTRDEIQRIRKTGIEKIDIGRDLEITEAEAVLKDGVINGGITSLLTFVESSPGKRTVDIAISLNISLRTTERWIKKLREEGKIEFRGSKKTGGYYVMGKQ